MDFVSRHCDYTLGIFQSIGFKEFHNYLTLSEEERENEDGQKLLLEGDLAFKYLYPPCCYRDRCAFSALMLCIETE